MGRLRRIAIIAGEPSGDLLAARLIYALQQQRPDLQFEGIAGPEMIAAGCSGLFSQEALSVMGLTENFHFSLEKKNHCFFTTFQMKKKCWMKPDKSERKKIGIQSNIKLYYKNNIITKFLLI